MIINQEKKFSPITITLDTAEEAEMFWSMSTYENESRTDNLKDMANKISNWFSNKAQLGG